MERRRRIESLIKARKRIEEEVHRRLAARVHQIRADMAAEESRQRADKERVEMKRRARNRMRRLELELEQECQNGEQLEPQTQGPEKPHVQPSPYRVRILYEEGADNDDLTFRCEEPS